MNTVLNTRIDKSITSFETFCNSKNIINNNSKDTAFLRCVGFDNSQKYINDILNMDKLLNAEKDKKQIGYFRITEFPKPMDSADIQYYTAQYDIWEGNNKYQWTLKANIKNPLILNTIYQRLKDIENVFTSNVAGANPSMCRNFIIKVMYWLDCIAQKLFDCQNEIYTAKLVVCCNIKRNEFLFLYYLAMIGIDIMILLPEGDIQIDNKLISFSVLSRLQNTGKIDIPLYREINSFSGNSAPYQSNTYNSNPYESNTNQPPRISIPPRPTIPSQNRPQMYPQPQSQTPTQIYTQPQSQTPTQMYPQRQPQIMLPPRQNISAQQNYRPQPTRPRTELPFEEIALLAASVVMIAIHNRRGETVASGSGIMISREGYILTNCHVIQGGEYFSVRIEDDTNIYETDEVIKYNTIFDLALIRINRMCKPIPIYNGNAPLVRGQKVVAIGSPLGLFNSVSDGIISGFRNIRDVDMIQFTAPISHGSSGGAVLNMYGEIIGISTAGIDSGQNINLAVDYKSVNFFTNGFTNLT